jgi:hypothetical protein
MNIKKNNFLSKINIDSLFLFIICISIWITLIVLDYFAKPQSDDWGWLVFIDHYGMLGSYFNMRETFQTSPYMLLIMFPFIVLQKFIPYSILLSIIQLSLPVAISIFIRKILLLDSKKDFINNVYLLTFTFVGICYLTTWNSNTFQNAIFWLTGLLAYVLPLTLFLLFLLFVIKPRKQIVQLVATYFLAFILAGVQINYIIIFGLILTWLTWKKQIFINKETALISIWLIFSLIYTWAYPGWLKRIPSANTLDYYDIAFNYFKLLTITVVKEPYWSLSFLLMLIGFSNMTKVIYGYSILKYHGKSLLSFISILLLISITLHLFAFKGQLGYGRVYFVSYSILIMVTVLLLLLIFNRFKIGNRIRLICLSLSLMLFYLPLKNKLYQSSRFSAFWIKRDSYLKNNKTGNNDCIKVKKLPKSGILGYVDLSDNVSCSDSVGYQNILTYGSIKNYDNWVFQQHYRLENKIVIGDTL